MVLKKGKNFKSLSKELLKVVFAFYFGITIIMTLIHFTIEYLHTEDNIKNELRLIASTFEPSLEQAIWNFDDEQIISVVEGALKLPIVLGIDIINKKTKEKIYEDYDKELHNSKLDHIIYSKDLYYDIGGKSEYIATVSYHTSSEIVFDRVKFGFLIIFINAALKSLILTFLFIWAFDKYLTIPLNKITQNIHNINLDEIEKQKELKIEHNKNNELVYLSKAFNKMLQNIKMQLRKLKDTQEHLVQSEKMVALGNMVAGVAHEINTPVGMALTGITHLSDETSKIKELYEKEEMSEEDFEHYLDINTTLNKSIHVNLTKAASLVKSFKMVAVDQSSDQIRDINLKQYIEEVLISLHNRLKKTKVEVIINCDENINISINAGAISQIVTNLIMNSIIHGFEDGTKEGTIEISATKDDKNLTLIYKDNGRGMSEAVKKKLFDPFFTTKRGKGGSGLGTTIIYNLVTTALKGSLRIDSDIDKGVKFTINIPL